MLTVVDSLVGTRNSRATLTVAGTGSRPDTTLTWGKVHERARRTAAVLARHGVGPHTRVGLLGDTTAALVTAAQAVWLRGAAFTVLPPPTRAGRAAHLANLAAIQRSARFTLVLTEDDHLDGVMPALPLSTVEAQAALARPHPIVRPAPGDLAVLQYTSGSTSSPRGVPVTHANLAANLDAIEAAIGPGALDPGSARWMSWLPLYHDMGLIGFLSLPMSRGCSLVLQSPAAFALRPVSWLERLSHHRATSTGGPNFAYGLVTRLLQAQGAGFDLSSVRYMFSGGEPIDAAMMARFAAAGARHGLDPRALVAAYGLAESTLAVSFSPIGEGVRVDDDGRVRVGQAVPGTQVRVCDGHVEVRGPSVVAGYWGEPPRESEWLRTGDLGYLTGDGELVICGRAKDVLFAAGRNVYPQDIEAAAARVPGVRPGGAAAFGLPADGGGDRLVVAVEARQADSELSAAVARAVAAETGMAPADVVTLRFGRLPKTSSGKLRRAEARHRYLTGTL